MLINFYDQNAVRIDDNSRKERVKSLVFELNNIIQPSAQIEINNEKMKEPDKLNIKMD